MKAKQINEINFERTDDPKRAMGTGKGQEEDMALGMKVFNVWLNNFESNFIEETWKSEPWLVKHLEEKFKGIVVRHNKGFAPAQCLIDFIVQLSNDRKMELFRYIAEKYKDRWG